MNVNVGRLGSAPEHHVVLLQMPWIGRVETTASMRRLGDPRGQRWDTDPRLRIWFHRFDAVILAVILIGIVVFVWTRWQGRIRADDAVQNGGL